MRFKKPIPEPFNSYVENKRGVWSKNTCYSAKGHLRHFCRFLEVKGLTLEKLTSEDIAAFGIYLRDETTVTPSWRLTTRKAIQTCLVRLSKAGVIKRDYRDWYPNYKHWPHLKGNLPPLAQDYLDLMLTTTKPSSRGRFRSDLIRFHQFLKDRELTLAEVRRRHIENFLKAMHKRGISPSTRSRAIITLRKYMYWLAERDHLGEDPEKLFLSKDIPPSVARLPRPFSPNIDAEVQNKFKCGGDIFYDALYLMRHTGLRAGELRDLEFNCLRSDERGNFFLKVPLGKLNTERLVPLTNDLVELIKKIQEQSKKHARNPNPSRLVIAPSGRLANFADFRARMDEIQSELPHGTTAQSHQLRHSCATSLLNHGMNIIALKELLGHKDIRMTLNYAKVAPDHIRREYESAVEKMREQIVAVPTGRVRKDDDADTEVMLSDLISALQKANQGRGNKQQNTIRTLRRLLTQLKKD